MKDNQIMMKHTKCVDNQWLECPKYPKNLIFVRSLSYNRISNVVRIFPIDKISKPDPIQTLNFGYSGIFGFSRIYLTLHTFQLLQAICRKKNFETPSMIIRVRAKNVHKLCISFVFDLMFQKHWRTKHFSIWVGSKFSTYFMYSKRS